MVVEGINLDQQFVNFAKLEDKKGEGKTIKLSTIDKWFKQAKVIDKEITTTDIAACFNKFKSKSINYITFLQLIEDLAQEKKLSVEKVKGKLEYCGLPGSDKKRTQ